MSTLLPSVLPGESVSPPDKEGNVLFIVFFISVQGLTLCKEFLSLEWFISDVLGSDKIKTDRPERLGGVNNRCYKSETVNFLCLSLLVLPTSYTLSVI